MTKLIHTSSGLRLYFPLQDLFPRKDHRDDSSIDEGHFAKAPCSLGACKGILFATVSIEYCPTCGYFVDYWEEDGKDTEKYLTSSGPGHLEEWYLLKRIEKLLQKEKCKPEDYSLSFHLTKKE